MRQLRIGFPPDSLAQSVAFLIPRTPYTGRKRQRSWLPGTNAVSKAVRVAASFRRKTEASARTQRFRKLLKLLLDDGTESPRSGVPPPSRSAWRTHRRSETESLATVTHGACWCSHTTRT